MTRLKVNVGFRGGYYVSEANPTISRSVTALSLKVLRRRIMVVALQGRKAGEAAAPPRSVMNSRRFTANTSRAFRREDSTPRHGRLLNPSTCAVRDDRDHAADNFFQGGSPKQATPISPPGPPHRQKSFQTKFPGMAPG